VPPIVRAGRVRREPIWWVRFEDTKKQPNDMSSEPLPLAWNTFMRQYRKIGNLDMAEAKLRHFASRPTLPNFYRRSARAE
jgi:hypothetical protein